MSTTSTVVFWSGFAIIALATIGSMFPLWKSATLSPDSIERRVFWTGCLIGVVVMFVAQLPDWKSSVIFSVGMSVALIAVAFNWTNHIKIGGRTYAAFNSLRRPDRPPALKSDGSDG